MPHKSPAFQFYPDDFLGSGKVGMMTPVEVGIYTLLLCLDWNSGGFVYDPARLARWCRTDEPTFTNGWALVGQCFEEKGGRWFNPRLERERQKQSEWREKSRVGGIKSGAARSKAAKGGSQMVRTKREPKTNTPSPSPSVTTTTKTTTIADAKASGNGASSWPVEAASMWGAKVGPIDQGRCGRSLKPVVDKYGWSKTRAGLSDYIELNKLKIRKIEYFVGDAVRWVEGAEQPLTDPSTGDLTARGNAYRQLAQREAQ